MKKYIIMVFVVVLNSCKAPQMTTIQKPINLPEFFTSGMPVDSSSAKVNWREYFADDYLVALIDSALQNNQDLKIALQQIEMARSGALASSAALKPRVSFTPTAALRRFGLYTMDGAGNITTDILPNKIVPIHLPDFLVGFQASWEIDLYKKLSNTHKSALTKVMASNEAKNYVVTNMVNEIASVYYELKALDAELAIIDEYTLIQENAVELIRIQKDAAAANELAVKQFEAQLYKLQEMKFGLQQGIIEQENTINYLMGRLPQPIARSTISIDSVKLKTASVGIPAQLLLNRPDLRQVELELQASRLDVQVARTAFLPSLNIGSVLGTQAFRPDLLITKPQSLVYGLVGGLAAPLINKRAIQADFDFANANQLAMLGTYNKQIISAYIEVYNVLMLQRNLVQSHAIKSKESAVLVESIDISDKLYRNNRATYLEVLAAQENALETRIELVQIKKAQLQSQMNLYKALGGGWR
jgi:NodT family efflux transporter outer membrane factor (OMF) lipoprotein